MWPVTILLVGIAHYTMGEIEVTPILSAPVTSISLSPIWDACTQSLYYVDLFAADDAPSIFRYDYDDDKVYAATIVGHSAPSFIIPFKDCNADSKHFIVSLGHNASVLEWDGKSATANVVDQLFAIEEDRPTSRLIFAAQKVEHGPFYVGTLNTIKCEKTLSSLYSYTKEKGVRRMFGNITVTGGLAFDDDAGKLYHLDPCQLQITEYSLDANGDTYNPRVVFDFQKMGYNLTNFIPIHLEMSTDGYLYMGVYNEGSIWKLDPKTSTAEPIARLPVNGLNGIAFGGENRDILYAIAGLLVRAADGKSANKTQGKTSLYKITGLNAKGRKHPRLTV